MYLQIGVSIETCPKAVGSETYMEIHVHSTLAHIAFMASQLSPHIQVTHTHVHLVSFAAHVTRCIYIGLTSIQLNLQITDTQGQIIREVVLFLNGLFCHCIGWCITKCPLYRGVFYSEFPVSEI